MNRFGQTLLSIVLGIATSGCFSAPQKLVYDQTELRGLLHQRMGDAHAGIVVPHEADEEMIRFAQKAVASHESVRNKLDALTRAITSKTGLAVRYEAGATLTARQVFEQRRANCIAYTALFVALARAVGMEAYYAEVSERSRFVRRAGTILHIGHICAVVRDGPYLLLVDFAQDSRREYLGYRLLDDVEAVASFFINQGVDFGDLLAPPTDELEHLMFTDEDLEKFELALLIRPGFTKALLNLGTANLLQGRTELAESQYRQAIDADPRFIPGYTALASLLYGQRKFTEALELYEHAASRQKKNPYLFYHLALANFTLRRYPDAKRAARTALELESSFADAHYLLGIIAQIDGEAKEARKRFREALLLDPSLSDAQARLRYLEGLDGASVLLPPQKQELPAGDAGAKRRALR